MGRTRILSIAMAMAAGMASAACHLDAGGNRNADEQKNGGGNAPVSGPEAAASGTQIAPGPPPVGTTNPLPPDTNTSTSTPNTTAPGDTGRLPEGSHPGATQGTQHRADP